MRPFLKIFKKKSSIEDRLREIKEGSKKERERLIFEYTPFIIKAITKITNKYIEVENNDEYSIGLEAFNEAIDRYDFQKGSFIKFAELVIRSRITDYQRREKNNEKVLSLNKENNEGLELQETIHEEDFTESIDLKDQIGRFKKYLGEFCISLEELAEEAPKHIDTRLNSINISRQIVKEEDIKEIIYRKKVLPMKMITERINVTKKILKGNRKFIIATVIILDKDLDLLESYISEVEGRVNSGI